MLLWCDLHVACNVLCTAISRAVVYKHVRFSKTLGMSHKIHACTALASVKFKLSCTVDLPTNFTLANLVQEVVNLQEQATQSDGVKCGSCVETGSSEVTAFCYNCKEFLCLNCT